MRTDAEIESDLKKIIDTLGTMPSAGTLSSMGRGDLSSQIQNRGGFRVWQKKLGAKPPHNYSFWPEGRLEKELRGMVLSLGYMPSNHQLASLGRQDMACQIAKSGGFISWAKKLNTNRIHSDSDTGWDGEKKLAEKLTSCGFTVTRMTGMKSPYDLSIENTVRIDVKSAKFAEYGACKGWFYRIGKNPQADVIALYQLDTGDCYYLPWQRCPTSNVTISRDGGKYKSYKNREDLLNLLVIERRQEEQIWNQKPYANNYPTRLYPGSN